MSSIRREEAWLGVRIDPDGNYEWAHGGSLTQAEKDVFGVSGGERECLVITKAEPPTYQFKRCSDYKKKFFCFTADGKSYFRSHFKLHTLFYSEQCYITKYTDTERDNVILMHYIFLSFVPYSCVRFMNMYIGA